MHSEIQSSSEVCLQGFPADGDDVGHMAGARDQPGWVFVENFESASLTALWLTFYSDTFSPQGVSIS